MHESNVLPLVFWNAASVKPLPVNTNHRFHPVWPLNRLAEAMCATLDGFFVSSMVGVPPRPPNVNWTKILIHPNGRRSAHV